MKISSVRVGRTFLSDALDFSVSRHNEGAPFLAFFARKPALSDVEVWEPRTNEVEYSGVHACAITPATNVSLPLQTSPLAMYSAHPPE